MKKNLFVCVVWVIVSTFALFSAVDEKKEEITQEKKIPRYTLCSQITKDSLKDVKASKKRIDNGVVIVLTSSNPGEVKKLKDIIASCKAKKTAADDAKKGKKEILSMEGVRINETNLNNGVRLELSSEIPEVVDKIKRLKIPGFLRVSTMLAREKK